MPMELFDLDDITATMEFFVAENRPPVEIRHQLDLGYRIEKQSVYLFEIRPDWENEEKTNHFDFAKTTYVKSEKIWKIFWMRGDLKWHSYDPVPEVYTLEDVLTVVSEDARGCFRG